MKLHDVHEPDMARGVLTNYGDQRALDGLKLRKSLHARVAARYRLLYGYRAPNGPAMSKPWARDELVECAKPLPMDDD